MSTCKLNCSAIAACTVYKVYEALGNVYIPVSEIHLHKRGNGLEIFIGSNWMHG